MTYFIVDRGTDVIVDTCEQMSARRIQELANKAAANLYVIEGQITNYRAAPAADCPNPGEDPMTRYRRQVVRGEIARILTGRNSYVAEVRIPEEKPMTIPPTAANVDHMVDFLHDAGELPQARRQAHAQMMDDMRNELARARDVLATRERLVAMLEARLKSFEQLVGQRDRARAEAAQYRTLAIEYGAPLGYTANAADPTPPPHTAGTEQEMPSGR